MVKRCKAVGVNIYVDALINHMCGADGSGVGTGGSVFDGTLESFPAVSFDSSNFNDNNCHTPSGDIENYQDVDEVRNCRLYSLLDLNQGDEYSVLEKLVSYSKTV